MIAVRILAPVLGFLFIAALLLPLRMVMSVANPAQAGLVHSDASGTAWSGTIRGASWRGAELGDLRVALQPASLLSGELAAAFRANGPISSGVLARRGDTWRFERLSGRIALAPLTPDLPYESALYVANAALTPSPAGCATASGSVNVEALPPPAVSSLEGNLSCEGDDLVMTLAPPQGHGEIIARIHLSGADAPRLTMSSVDPALQAALDMLGLPVAQPPAPPVADALP